MMKRYDLMNEEAVSPVIGAILIMAIGVTLITNMQINSVPVWNLQEDLAHLEKMTGDLNELKSNIDNSVIKGSILTSPLNMGFRYSPKGIFYNPREAAIVTLSIKNDAWAEVRYNEILPDGLDDATSIKNLSRSSITYSLQATQTINPFSYEHGVIWRSGYTKNDQTLLVNNVMKLLSVKAAEQTYRETGERLVNIYPMSQPKNSIIATNVYLRLQTGHADWWAERLQEKGGNIKIKDPANGSVIAYFDRVVLNMGEAQITLQPHESPVFPQPYRLVTVPLPNNALPIDGTTAISVEVQDIYNNPVTNVQINFSLNTSKTPSNAYLSATLLQNSAVSGVDGRASIQIKSNGAGIYYIDASIANSPITTTFSYPATSQGWSLTLSYNEIGADTYDIMATVTDAEGIFQNNKKVYFEASNGTLSPQEKNTNATGNALTTLDSSSAGGLKITNIQNARESIYYADISWETMNMITVSGLVKKVDNTNSKVFNAIDIPAKVHSNGCIHYGTSPGEYSLKYCDTALSYSHSVTLEGLEPYTAYYFIVNSSRPGGESVNSTEYMFTTDYVHDIFAPASISNINPVISPLSINWAWTDPVDEDLHHVEVYIDGILRSNVSKGVQYFKADYFRPNTMHTISTRTVDSSNNRNTTWVNNTATTPSLYTYVFDFLNTTGNVTDPDSAKNGSDSGASAIFTESLVFDVDRNNYTYVSSNIPAKGTLTGFANMTAEGDNAYATMTEGQSFSTFVQTWGFLTDLESWTPTGTSWNSLTMSHTGDGSPSARCIFSKLDGGPSTITTWTSPYFTWTNGMPISARLDFRWKVKTFDSKADPSYYYVILVKPDGSTSEIYPKTMFNAQADYWSAKSNVSVSPDDFSQSGNYQLQLIAELNTWNPSGKVEVRWDTPTITLGYNSYSLDIATGTSSVPKDTYYYLEINYSRDSNENGYDIFLYDGAVWNKRGSLTSNTWDVFSYQLNNVTEYLNGNPQIRYVDQNPLGSTRGNLYIDYQRIHGNTPARPPVYRLNITTNTTSITSTLTMKLQIRYNVSGDSFMLQLWNGTAWNNRSTLNSAVMTPVEIALNPGEFIATGTISGEAGSITQGYVLVRYVDVTASTSQQGRLYLDYQRVLSS